MSKHLVRSRNNLIVFLAFVPLLLLAPSSFTYVENDETLLNSEAQKVPPVDINSTPSDAEASTSLGDDVNTPSIRLSCGIQNNPLHQKLISRVKEIQSVAGGGDNRTNTST